MADELVYQDSDTGIIFNDATDSATFTIAWDKPEQVFSIDSDQMAKCNTGDLLAYEAGEMVCVEENTFMDWETYETASALLGGWTVLLVALMVLVAGIVRGKMAPSPHETPEGPMIVAGSIAATLAAILLFLLSPLSRIPITMMVGTFGLAGCTLALWAPIKARLQK